MGLQREAETREERPVLESLNITLGSFSVCDPPAPPQVIYYYSRMSANNICFLYRVTMEEEYESSYRCHPEAKGWPELLLTREQLDKHFRELSAEKLHCYKSAAPLGVDQVRYPDMEELRRQWHVGSNVFFRHNDIRNTGIVVGRFVWEETKDCSNVRFVLLLQLPTNRLLLSCEVTDLQLDPDELAKNKEEVYIQGISLVGIVATLIANVTYLASVTPPRGFDSSPGRDGVAFASRLNLPTAFLLFNSIAFYSSVLAVVVMTAFIPIYGTAGEWGAIFLSSSLPVVLSLVAFYISFMFSSWASLDSFWLKPLFMTVLGVAMVLYVRFWAIELMEGHIDRHLRVMKRISPWQWYVRRAFASGNTVPSFLERCERSFKSVAESLLAQRSLHAIATSSKTEQKKARFIFSSETQR